MSIFSSDTFTTGADTALTSHTGEVGATWANHPSGGATPTDLAATGRVYNSSGTALCYTSGVPASADYDVSCDVIKLSSLSQQISVCGRMDTSANTMYFARYNSDTQWELFRIVAGSAASLGTAFSQSLTVGQAYRLMLRMRGNQISLLVDSVARIGPVTDSNISAAGRAGVRMGAATSTTGYHMDNFVAEDTSATAFRRAVPSASTGRRAIPA